jgi:hypothetical protein
MYKIDQKDIREPGIFGAVGILCSNTTTVIKNPSDNSPKNFKVKTTRNKFLFRKLSKDLPNSTFGLRNYKCVLVLVIMLVFL